MTHQEKQQERSVEEIELNERIKKTHTDCECCRNWTRICELKVQAERQKREEMVEKFLKKLQLLVDVKTQGTGMVGYQLTGRYPTTGDHLLERELQTYYEVTVSIETIAKKYGIDLTQPNNPKV